MNNSRRKQLTKAITQLEDVQQSIEEIKDEEQDAFDNMLESLQDAERGETMMYWVELLEDALSNIEEAHDNLENIE